MTYPPTPYVAGGAGAPAGVFPGVGPWQPPTGEPSPDSEEEIILRREEERLARQDLVDLVGEQHRRVNELVTEAGAADVTDDRRADVVQVLVAEVSRSATVEQRFLWPTMRAHLPEGDRLADEAAGRHEEIAAGLARLTAEREGDPAGEYAVRHDDLAVAVDRHQAALEGSVLPLLRERCDPAELRKLAAEARAARDLAPTRPHPHAPEDGVLRRATEPVLGAVDKVRDELTGRPTRPSDLD